MKAAKLRRMRRALFVSGVLAVVAVSVHAASAPVAPAAPGSPRAPVRPIGTAPPIEPVKPPAECVPGPNAPLEVYLPFDGNAADASGHCHEAMVWGATLTSDRANVPGRAYAFDADDTMVLKRETNLSLSKFTLAFWVKPTDLPRPWAPCPGVGCCAEHTVLLKASGKAPEHSAGNFNVSLFKCGGASYTTLAYAHANAPAAGATGALQFTHVYDKTKFLVGAWRHVAVTYDGAMVRIYVDGTLSSTSAAPPPMLNDHPVRLGRKPVVAATQEFDQPFQGSLDEVRIYDHALSAAEVTALHSPPSREAPLTAPAPSVAPR